MTSAPLAVLMACHNRRDKTLRCLARLRESAALAGLGYQLYVFDDGSTDGTASAVQAFEPGVTLLHGDGSRFWNRSMHEAFAAALRVGHAMYLWLNDDTDLEPGALRDLAATLASAPAGPAIAVGAVRDPDSGALTYGGSRRPDARWRPFYSYGVAPSGKPEPIEMFNGNVVLISSSAARLLGNIDPHFEHSMGDTDYGLRAGKLGVALLLSPSYAGCCSRNAPAGTMRDRRQPLALRWRHAMSRKGLPPRSWFLLCRRHGGPLWPVVFAWAYLKVVLNR